MNVQWIDELLSRRRWAVHLMYWLVILVLYAIFFGRTNSNYLQTLFFVGMLLPVAIGATYFLNYFLLPRHLLRGKYFTFALYLFYLLLGALFLQMLIVLFTFMVVAEMKIKNMSPASIDVYFLLASLLTVIFLGGGIKLLLYWKSSKEDLERLMREKVETELKLLKSQLNPHFLFNTLNNLYYLTTKKSDRAPAAILQLSEILDYVMNRSASTLVSLSDEVSQMDNYIEIEKLRYEDRVSISRSMSGDLGKFKVPHMLLITLIENAFKHGVMPHAHDSFINISVRAEGMSLSICIENNSNGQSRQNGIGLANLRHQLELLYPDRHELTIEPMDKVFKITLTLFDSHESEVLNR